MTLLEESGVEAEVIKYLDEELSESMIKELLLKLDIDAIDLMRTKEDKFKELMLDKVGDEGVLIRAMVRFPKLIERPIVIKGNKAVIGRPPEKVIELLK
jgi:arsenate reductase